MISISQDVLAKQLQAWQVVPQPQRFSQLYFTNYRKLPVNVKVGGKQKLSFTIHNDEHRTTNYSYEVAALSMNSNEERALSKGEVSLQQDQTQTIEQIIAVPALDSRVMVRVKLTYSGIAFGASDPSLQTQSIHHWITFSDYQSGQKGAL